MPRGSKEARSFGEESKPRILPRKIKSEDLEYAKTSLERLVEEDELSKAIAQKWANDIKSICDMDLNLLLQIKESIDQINSDDRRTFRKLAFSDLSTDACEAIGSLTDKKNAPLFLISIFQAIDTPDDRNIFATVLVNELKLNLGKIVKEEVMVYVLLETAAILKRGSSEVSNAQELGDVLIEYGSDALKTGIEKNIRKLCEPNIETTIENEVKDVLSRANIRLQSLGRSRSDSIERLPSIHASRVRSIRFPGTSHGGITGL